MTQKHHIPSELETFVAVASAAFGFSVLFLFGLSSFVNTLYQRDNSHGADTHMAAHDAEGKKTATKHGVSSDKPHKDKQAGAKTAGTNKSITTASLSQLLTKANPKKGAKVAKKCLSCHSMKKGEKSKSGPNLYAIIGRKIAKVSGYKYSSAMKKYAQKSGHWKYDNLGAYLQKPRKIVPKTKMSFAGIRKQGDLINLIAYLRSNADKPAPLPIY